MILFCHVEHLQAVRGLRLCPPLAIYVPVLILNKVINSMER